MSDKCIDIPKLEVGAGVWEEILITSEMVKDFARVVNDPNSIHLSDESAREAGFQGRIAQGVLILGIISGIISRRLPGPGSVIRKMPALDFGQPVMIGDTINVKVTIKQIRRNLVKLRVECTVDGVSVIEPDGEVLVALL